MISKYPKTLMNVVLVEPEIPNNTGTIGRSCVGLWSKLHLVGPLGFQITDKQLKRSGLDYWPNLDWTHYPDWTSFEAQLPQDRSRIHLIETGSQKSMYDIQFREGDFLLFGRETVGLPMKLRELYSDRIFSVPYPGKVRSFNLSNCVAMVMSQAYSQFIKTDQKLGLLPSC